MLKLKQRNDGRYVATVTVNGKRKFYYGDSPSEVEKKIVEAKFLTYQGINIDDNKITFKEWAEKWYEVSISQKEYNTKRNIRVLLDNHIYPSIGSIKLKDLKVYNIKQLQKNMLEEGLTSTCNRTITTIKRVLNDAIENDIIQKNVAFNIKSVKYDKVEKKPLTTYEDNLLLKVAETHKYGLFFLILRYTGLRTEEIVPLTVGDIDLTNKRINVNKAVYFEKNNPNIKTTKNKKARKVPILDIIYNKLKEEVKNKKKDDLLFTKQTDKKMLTTTSTRWMLTSFLIAINKLHEKEQKEKDKKFVLNDENKIYFTNHQLRHSYCTMLYYAGIKIKKAQELMGHSSADMVYNIYTHLDEERENVDDTLNTYCSQMRSQNQ